ncbi:hypothetical protein [Streptomyces canus]|uniref:hypothetical protein n=1 Tax=Streptomyces canus TaxID=58343 RepID=UPI0036EE1E3B
MLVHQDGCLGPGVAQGMGSPHRGALRDRQTLSRPVYRIPVVNQRAEVSDIRGQPAQRISVSLLVQTAVLPKARSQVHDLSADQLVQVGARLPHSARIPQCRGESAADDVVGIRHRIRHTSVTKKSAGPTRQLALVLRKHLRQRIGGHRL